MAFGGIGMGFLPTDPRSKKGPTGGSIKAGQPQDTSPIITGDPRSGGIGFASPSATGGLFAKPYVAPAPDPEYQAKTSAEWRERNKAMGIADTHANMGSLAVDFREQEAALKAAGKPTVTEMRDQKIIDTREAEEYKRTVLEPAAAEGAKFRAQAASAKDMFKKYRADDPKATISAYKSTGATKVGATGRTTALSNAKKTTTGGTKVSKPASGYQSVRSNIGPDHSWFLSAFDQEAQERAAVGSDLLAMAATRAHSQAPSTQPKTAIEMAHAQSASGQATPGEMGTAMRADLFRKGPNK